VHRRTQTRRTFDEQLDRSRGEKDHLEIGVLERTPENRKGQLRSTMPNEDVRGLDPNRRRKVSR